MLLYIIYLIGGLLIGAILTSLYWINYIHFITYGTLRYIRDSKDSDPYLFLDLDEHPDTIKRRDRVVFKVDPNEIRPHE